jgi:hypothetical protein
MKRIVYLSFYFKPDLCAGSFRNSPLAIELANQAKDKNIFIEVFTTMPNRYSTFEIDAPEFEQIDNLIVNRVKLPLHKSGMIDQIYSFLKFYKEVKRQNKGKEADLVFASSSRLFTAFLGYKIAKDLNTKLYLDIRDIFVDTMNDVFKSKILKFIVLPILKYIESITFNYAKHINLISGGFKDYFKKFKNPSISFFSNGIDDEFINETNANIINVNHNKLIVYAGNLGEGQGLHKIIPQAANLLGSNYQFLIIGDGGAKKLLQKEIINLNVKNVKLLDPVNRNELQKIYKNANFLFLHLNDYPAFKKVLPSKIFELATLGKPILAGVSGFSAEFIKNELSNCFVFNPCDYEALSQHLLSNENILSVDRREFIEKYKRSQINKKMANSILSYI